MTIVAVAGARLFQDDAVIDAQLPAGSHLSSASWSFEKTTTAAHSNADTDVLTTPSAEGAEYHSQYGEDQYANDHFFHNMTQGLYLELGALDGREFTNTLFFAQRLGWKGLLVEANPTKYAALKVNRPNDVCVHAAACGKTQAVHFLAADLVGGIYEFMSEEFKRIWHASVVVDDLPVVSCLPLSSILNKVGLRQIDFLSLDTEGAELQVLSTLDFSLVQILVIVVEADGTNPQKDLAIQELLRANGFRYHDHVVHNDWFVHESFVSPA